MLINIRQILSGERKSIVIDTSIGLDDINLNKQNLKFVSSPRVKGKLLKLDAQLIFEGELDADVEVLCAVCDEAVIQSVNTEFKVYLTDKSESFVMEYDTYVYVSDEVDISEIVAIETWGELPVKVVCQEDCKGLCPTCGANLNIENCNCNENDKVVDIRLQKLKELIK